MLHADPAFDPAPGSRRRWAIFVAGCLGFFLSMFYRVSTAVIAPDLVRDLGLDSAQMGALGAAFYYSFALCQIPLALALDRLGARATLTGLAVFGVAGAALFGLAQDYHQALLARLLLGLGMSGALMGVFALLAAWFPINRFGFVSGIQYSGSDSESGRYRSLEQRHDRWIDGGQFAARTGTRLVKRFSGANRLPTRIVVLKPGLELLLAR